VYSFPIKRRGGGGGGGGGGGFPNGGVCFKLCSTELEEKMVWRSS
jgi:hypothetical protein